MQASETKLQQIIEGIKQYLVPLFQRPYSWKKSEWQILWDDLEELCTSSNPRPHFIGSFVTMPATSVPEGVHKYLLIDGQQRLTTIFILFCAIRDKAKQLEQYKLAEEIDNTILFNQYEEGSDRYKLQPTQSDIKAFQSIIDKSANLDNNDLTNCYLFFQKNLAQTQLELTHIKKVLCRSLSLISVVLSTEDDPYLVFESLNAKGRALTQADLIRNYLFMRIKTDEQESVYGQYWLPMQQLLGDNLTEFIRHYLTKDGREVRQNEVYFEIKELLKQGSALSYLQDLYKFAQYYANFLEPELEQKIKVRKYLQRIKRLEVATVYPFLLNCYEDCQQGKITEDELLTVLQILENFLLRRFICNVQTRGLNRIFATLYSQITKEATLTDENFIQNLKLALQNRDYPHNVDFKERLKDVKLYGQNRSEKAKIILESIEESFNHKEQVLFDNLTLEHIMPQTLTAWWKEHLGEDWALTHELYLHSLGNLTLTAYNPSLSNSDFLAKVKEFKNSHLELNNKYFVNQQSWQREDIETRAEYLADIALQIWSYFGDTSKQSTKVTDLKGSKPKLLRIFRQEYSVKSWRDVLEITLNKIAELEPDKFQEIMQQFPRFISDDEKNFRSSRQLRNGNFVEVNLSATDIYTLCLRALEIAELSIEDWKVETQN